MKLALVAKLVKMNAKKCGPNGWYIVLGSTAIIDGRFLDYKNK